MNPYFVMAGVFAGLAGLMAFDLALVNAGLIPMFSGIRWLRVHLVTLGIMTELLFGLLPGLVAGRGEPSRRETAWGTFLLLNGGILALLVGVPTVNEAVTYAGGTMVFLATVLLIDDVRRTRSDSASQPSRGAAAADAGRPSGRWFYATGLGFFLFGITVGTGLLFNWAGPLRIRVPIEVHVHANSWGLMSLAFAGLVVDLLPRWSGRALAWPGAVRPIYWLMTLGAAGLVAGPWTGAIFVTAPGLIMHLTSTVWLLAMVVASVRGTPLVREPGIWHLLTGYAWILAPVAVAPFVILAVPGFPGGDVEANAPQALVYGWMLQLGVAVLPFALRRELRPDEPARLGGSWLTLAALHGGGALLWAGVFLGAQREVLHAAAYGLWALALGVTGIALWSILPRAAAGRARVEASAPVSPLPRRKGGAA